MPRKRQSAAATARSEMMTVAALHHVGQALHRLRRAAFGLDHEDRLAEAERFTAMHAAPKRQARRRARA
jgi:hypothetical protein